MNPDSYLDTLAATTRRRFAFAATTAEEARRWQWEFRRELARLLGTKAIAARGKASLTAELLSSTEEADHRREEWLLETEPGFRLPFSLLRPLAVRGRRPLVLAPQGHYRLGKATSVGLAHTAEDREQMESEELDIARQAVRQGYLAIAPEMRGFGSLRRKEELDEDANNSCRPLQMQALLFGRTLLGERVWDVQRVIDWALSRKEVCEDVDAGAVVITGNSGGGAVALFAAALDARIGICIPGSYFCTFRDSIGAIRHCECNYVPGLLRLAEMHEVAGLVAPRPFLAVHGRTDPIFPSRATQESFARLEEIYRVLEAPERCRLSLNEGGHRYYKRDVWPFVKQVLQEDAAP